MNFSTKSNMYTTTLETGLSLFDHYISGEKSSLLLIISSTPLSEKASSAFESSFARLEWGQRACTYVSLSGTAGSNGDLPTLSSTDLFLLVESLDPSLLIVADDAAAAVVAEAYRCELSPDSKARIFGRESRVFASFEDMIADEHGKQKAWALLKSLPKLAR